MLIKRLNLLPSYKKHVFSLIFSLLCMAAAMGFSHIYYNVTGGNTVNVALTFTFFLVLVSCNTVGYVYGILYSLLASLYFFHINIIFSDYPLTFLCLSAVTIWVSTLTSQLAFQSGVIADKEKMLTEAETEKMRANLLRAVSHDLRSPLAGMIGSCAAFLENQPRLSEEEKRNIVANIYEDANWLINMAENLLTVTLIRDQGLNINTREEPVEEVVAETLQKMKKRHPDCVIHTEVPVDFIMLPMDAVLIEQVAINLLENALRHASCSAPIDFIVRDMGMEVTFTVRDYGTGIPSERLDKLFDGPGLMPPGPEAANAGMGIGLTICKTIITAHHGALTGKNHDCGAEFTFTLPKSNEAALSPQKGSPHP